MKKFTNHIDHVAWISRPENLDANIAQLEKLADAKLQRFEREDMGFVMYLNWEAGLEVVSPMPERTDFNQLLHDWLDTRGEGVMSVEVGPLMDDHPDSPWHHKLNLQERIAGTVMNSTFVLGDIDYADGLIPFGDA